MARVYRRGSRWGIDYVDPWRDPERVREMVADRKRDAQLELAHRLAEIDARRAADPGLATRTLEVAIRTWAQHAEQKASLATDVQRLGRATEYFGGDRLLTDITPESLDRFRGWLLEQPRRGRRGGRAPTLDPQTCNRTLDALRSVLRLATRNGWLDRSPADGLRRCVEPEPRDRVASDLEIEAILRESARSPDMRLAIVLAVDCAMRRGEIWSLCWEHLDMELGLATLTRTKTRTRRTVALTRRAVELLEARTGPRTGLVMRTALSSVGARWHRIRVRAGCPDLRFHDLRATAATRMRRAGVDVVVVKKVGGWRSWATMERYQTVGHRDLLGAAQALEGVTSRA